MKPRDFAVEIEPDASPVRLHEIEQVLHRFAAEILIQASAIIDDDALHGRMNFAHQAAKYCRETAHEHLNKT